MTRRDRTDMELALETPMRLRAVPAPAEAREPEEGWTDAELLVRVKALLRRGPVTRASVLRIGDLELDRLSQQVKRAGKRVELTAKEYGVLEYLMANAGRVLSRTMILEHVWDQSFDGATNIVDVYVRHLRSKVDDVHEHKLIRTIRGLGYVISEHEVAV